MEDVVPGEARARLFRPVIAAYWRAGRPRAHPRREPVAHQQGKPESAYAGMGRPEDLCPQDLILAREVDGVREPRLDRTQRGFLAFRASPRSMVRGWIERPSRSRRSWASALAPMDGSAVFASAMTASASAVSLCAP